MVVKRKGNIMLQGVFMMTKHLCKAKYSARFLRFTFYIILIGFAAFGGLASGLVVVLV